MSYKYQLSEEAELDVLEGFVWYESKKIGLGKNFWIHLTMQNQKLLAIPKLIKLDI